MPAGDQELPGHDSRLCATGDLAESFGVVGKEGTGSYGAGLLRFLADYGLTMIEVDRPDRAARRRNAEISSGECGSSALQSPARD